MTDIRTSKIYAPGSLDKRLTALGWQNQKAHSWFRLLLQPQSLLSRTPDPKDVSKDQIRIRAFLQSEKTAVTALVKLLPLSHAFLSGSWERCEGGLSGALSVACRLQPLEIVSRGRGIAARVFRCHSRKYMHIQAQYVHIPHIHTNTIIYVHLHTYTNLLAVVPMVRGGNSNIHADTCIYVHIHAYIYTVCRDCKFGNGPSSLLSDSVCSRFASVVISPWKTQALPIICGGPRVRFLFLPGEIVISDTWEATETSSSKSSESYSRWSDK